MEQARLFLTFTFHSGTILIDYIDASTNRIELYIPLWYDSNLYENQLSYTLPPLHSTLVRF